MKAAATPTTWFQWSFNAEKKPASKKEEEAAAILLVACQTKPPDRGVTLTYRVVGQCDTLFGSVDGNGNPIADRPGAVNLVIAIFKEENNRPQAVDFKLIDSNLFINVAEGHQTFDFDSLVRSPSPFLIPPPARSRTGSCPTLQESPGCPTGIIHRWTRPTSTGTSCTTRLACRTAKPFCS